jgi:hypothetical protein
MPDRLRIAVGDVFGRACSLIDGLPEWTWRIPGLHNLGCPHGLAVLAFRIYPPWYGVIEETTP